MCSPKLSKGREASAPRGSQEVPGGFGRRPGRADLPSASPAFPGPWPALRGSPGVDRVSGRGRIRYYLGLPASAPPAQFFSVLELRRRLPRTASGAGRLPDPCREPREAAA